MIFRGIQRPSPTIHGLAAPDRPRTRFRHSLCYVKHGVYQPLPIPASRVQSRWMLPGSRYARADHCDDVTLQEGAFTWHSNLPKAKEKQRPTFIRPSRIHTTIITSPITTQVEWSGVNSSTAPTGTPTNTTITISPTATTTTTTTNSRSTPKRHTCTTTPTRPSHRDELHLRVTRLVHSHIGRAPFRRRSSPRVAQYPPLSACPTCTTCYN